MVEALDYFECVVNYLLLINLNKDNGMMVCNPKIKIQSRTSENIL